MSDSKFLWYQNTYSRSFDYWSLDLSSKEKIILMCLEMHSNGKGIAWPSFKTIAKETSISAVHVENIIKGYVRKKKGELIKNPGLIGKGFIKIIKKGKSNTYQLLHEPGCSYKGKRTVWTFDDLNSSQKLIWMCAEKYLTLPRSQWPGLKGIAKECGITYRQILNLVHGYTDKRSNKRVKGLLELGYLREIPQINESNIYIPEVIHNQESEVKQLPLSGETVSVFSFSSSETITSSEVKQLCYPHETVTNKSCIKNHVKKEQQYDVYILNKLLDEGIKEKRAKKLSLKVTEHDIYEAIRYTDNQLRKNNRGNRAGYLADCLDYGYYKAPTKVSAKESCDIDKTPKNNSPPVTVHKNLDQDQNCNQGIKEFEKEIAKYCMQQ